MKPRMESNSSSPVVVGVDIGKNVFHLVGFTADIRRLELKEVFEKLPPCIVAMEACLSAHFVSRTLRALGHEPRIVPAIYVKPFVKICGLSRRRARTSWTCRLATGCDRDWCLGERQRSIKFGLF